MVRQSIQKRQTHIFQKQEIEAGLCLIGEIVLQIEQIN